MKIKYEEVGYMTCYLSQYDFKIKLFPKNEELLKWIVRAEIQCESNSKIE